MGERQWSEDELVVARAASSVPRPGEGAWLNAGTFTDYWQKVARAVLEAQRKSWAIDPAELPEWERKLIDREQEIRDQVRVTRADYRVQTFGRWWRIPGHYNVAIPGVMVVGPVRRREVPRWIEHVIRKALAGHPEEANAAEPAPDDQLQLDLATAIARIMQAYKEPAMREFLLWRLYECDVPRLRAYLNDESLTLLAEVGHG